MANGATNQSPNSQSKNNPLNTAPSKLGLFAAYAEMPSDVKFETQDAGEKVLLFLRPHLITNLPSLILVILMIIAPFFIFPLVWNALNLHIATPAGYLIIGTLFWYVATFGFVLASFMRWYFNIYIVTNERIVDIDFYYMLYKHFSEARIEKIQDLSFKTSGILAAFFNFGTVVIQTAGELPNFDFASIPQPEKVVKLIGDLIESKHTTAKNL